MILYIIINAMTEKKYAKHLFYREPAVGGSRQTGFDGIHHGSGAPKEQFLFCVGCDGYAR